MRTDFGYFSFLPKIICDGNEKYQASEEIMPLDMDKP